ncbi:MAG TPA: hypothetical protein VE783_07510 [Candidatus Limnocylindrales bacterium]|jgi:hypothetical protein|nr:hypothetical protein [Candidatus Limnocylindrales bacterium]
MLAFIALLIFSITPLVMPGAGINGVKIVTRQVSGGMTDVRTEYMTPDKLRSEWQTPIGDKSGPAMASIVYRGERERVYVLDLQAHEYITYEHGSPAINTHSMPSSGGVLRILIEYIDTGERKVIFGHMARHVLTHEKRYVTAGACSQPSESETDGWYIEPSVMPDWRQKKNGVGVVVASVVSTSPSNRCQDKTDHVEVHVTGAEPGFPVKVSTTLKSQIPGRDGTSRPLESTWGSEVVEMKEGPLDPALFDIPGDFKLVQSLRNWAVASTPKRELAGWEWVKAKLQEMFH